MPNTGNLLNAFLDLRPEAATRRRILVDNPARLYRFSGLRSGAARAV